MKPHPRSKLVTGHAQGFCTTTFGVWDSTHVMFGDKKDGSSITRDVVLGNNQNFNEVRNYDDGGPARVILRPVPVGEEKDKFMFIDLVQQVRAVYFPVDYKSGPQSDHLCTYLMVDFRLHKGAEIRVPSEDKSVFLPFGSSIGLGYRHYETLCFDMGAIYDYLSVPRQTPDTQEGLYQTAVLGQEPITLLNCHAIFTDQSTVKVERQFIRSIALDGVLHDNFNVDVVGDRSSSAAGCSISWSMASM
ncbi:MAG: hypothetical protein Q9182_001157 [Xanthomendoza sp. 2 TL-2023]